MHTYIYRYLCYRSGPTVKSSLEYLRILVSIHFHKNEKNIYTYLQILQEAMTFGWGCFPAGSKQLKQQVIMKERQKTLRAK